MRSAVISLFVAGTSALLFAACGSSSPPPIPGPTGGPPGPPPWGTSAPGTPACGMTMFVEPACEAALDRACCTHQQACAADADCAKFMRCWNYCEDVRRQMKARNEPGGCDCFNNCAGPNVGPGVKYFGAVANCSKDVHYPQGLECRSGC